MSRLYCWPKLEPVWEKAGVIRYPHQEQACVKIIHDMGGRGILADEVGLGKTVEAGLVMYELVYRGLVGRVLILVPPALTGQWEWEMREKFDLGFCVNPRGSRWLDEDRIIASIDLAKRDGHREFVTIKPFDLVIVDEAHRLKNDATRSHRLVRDLNCKYLLLLTATPMQNNLNELYNLVSLVSPDLFGDRRQFRTSYTRGPRTPANCRQLREELQKVMVRNYRSDIDRWFPARDVQLVTVHMAEEEMGFYRAVSNNVRREYMKRKSGGGNVLPLITLQKEACSSYQAAVNTLALMDLPVPEVPEVLPAKTAACLDLVEKSKEQILVFVEFRATQELISSELRRRGIDHVVLNGQMNSRQRQQCYEQFAAGAQVMVSTECGGQGLNFQFCWNVINYDLPWNPMRIEQRIGRVHRLGQKRDVRIVNLAAEDTIETHVVAVLHEKVAAFVHSVGDLEAVIRQAERRVGVERRVLAYYVQSETEEVFRSRLEELAEELTTVSCHQGWDDWQEG